MDLPYKRFSLDGNDSSSGADLSEYERKRLANIAANRAMLATMIPSAFLEEIPATEHLSPPSKQRPRRSIYTAPRIVRPQREAKKRQNQRILGSTPVAVQRFENRSDTRKARTPMQDQEDRRIKSEFFNNLQVGDKIRVVRNVKTGHHDVTNKNPEFDGRIATIRAVPVYPSTWLAVELLDDQIQIKVRTSQIRPLHAQSSAGNDSHRSTGSSIEVLS